MNKFIVSLVLLLGIYPFSNNFAQMNKADVMIYTDAGNVSIKLFDETPKHKENFLKLVESSFYNGSEFHRVIKNFMIQGGDGNTKPNPSQADRAQSGQLINAEISPKYVHTRGMLAAARTGDQVNPEWKSSGCQFYIVTGNNVSEAQLKQVENQVYNAMVGKKSKELQPQFLQQPDNAALYQKYQTAVQAKDSATARQILNTLNTTFNQFLMQNVAPFEYTPEQVQAYLAKGGAPWLDMQYTIFGEVVEGMDIVAKIEATETVPGDKPKTPIRIIRMEKIAQ